MDINNALKNELFDNGIYDAWQFVKNTTKTLSIAEYSKDVIIDLISKMAEEHEKWKDSLFFELFSQDNNVKSVSVTTDNLPAYKITVASNQVAAPFLLDKLTKDFFQYVRNSFDSMSQIVNVALLAFNAKKPDTVDFPAMLKAFNQQPYSQNFPHMTAWYNKIATSDEFTYIDAFNNRTKHTYDIYLKVSMAFMGGENSAEINPFFRKNTSHGKKDITTYLNEIFDFVMASFESFMSELAREYPKKLYVSNRFNKLKAYQQKMNDSPDSNFSVVYIETSEDICLMPDEISILLLSKSEDGEIYSKNCEVDTVYVKSTNSDHDYIGKYVAIEAFGDDTLLKYRKYRKECQAPNALPLCYQAMDEWKKKPIFYKANPFLDFTTVSDDNSFLARVQLPF